MSLILSIGSAYLAAIAAAFFIGVVIPISYRKVVPTNKVHIVQSRKKTKAYGIGAAFGNVYYRWPSWVPLIGLTVIELDISNFDLSLEGYEAYDKDRVPFVVDITAFFRISDTNTAARRISSTKELYDQLRQIIQGAVRKVLAGSNIHEIMLERSRFGEQFTDEVKAQLAQWGVEPVKAMELMDIRDSKDSHVIKNIMAMKTSKIEMDSRCEVAENMRSAEIAEISAQKEIDIKEQEAQQMVGESTANKNKAIGIANEQSDQEILKQKKTTQENEMEVKKVLQVQAAEIERQAMVVAAQQDKETNIIMAEGQLAARQREAEGIKAVGEANADAQKAMNLANIEPQIQLAREIGTNQGYQNYLALVEAIAAFKLVGQEQARALQDADVKVIANSGHAGDGMKSVMDLFTSSGGTNIAGMVEALAQSPLGNGILEKFIAKKEQAGSDSGPKLSFAGDEARPKSADNAE